jgi:hypothetical protein
MPDSQAMEAEPRLQPGFSIAAGLAGLLLFVLLIAVDQIVLRGLPDRSELGPRSASVSFEPISLGRAAFGPLRLRGAWTVDVDDPRFGGISALALDGGRLLAMTDSGVLVRLPRPGSPSRTALLDELPGGPADARFLRHRDSEALLRDPQGRGWWVAFENRHQLWLYASDFERPIARVGLGRRWRANWGIEAMTAAGYALLLFPERAGTAIRLSRGQAATSSIPSGVGPVSDAAAIAGSGILLVERKLTPLGFANALVRMERTGGGYRAAGRVALGLGPFDNVEAIAIEPHQGGGATLWLMTDDNFQRPFRSLLIALEVPAGKEQP